MKNIIASITSLLLTSAIGLVASSNAFADANLAYDYENRSYNPDSDISRDILPGASQTIWNAFNWKHFNGAGSSYNEFGSRYFTLPGSRKRNGVFKLERLNASKEREDLLFNTKEDANNFCTALLDLATYFHSNIREESRVLAISGTAKKVIAVPYSIAYDAGSTQADDGGSTSARKYVLCPNPWNWIPNPKWDDENESTGVLSSNLRDGTAYYDVTCVDSTKPKTTFWFNRGGAYGTITEATNGSKIYQVYTQNLKTLHNYNEFIGARYCSAS